MKRWEQIRERVATLELEQQALGRELKELHQACAHPELPERNLPDDAPYADTCPDCGFYAYCHVLGGASTRAPFSLQTRGGTMSDPGRKAIEITLEELRTLVSSAIGSIHGEVHELFADGQSRAGRGPWTAESLRAKRDELAGYFDRAIELCDALESTAFGEKGSVGMGLGGKRDE